MIKDKTRNAKGVTLISLAIAVVILILIANLIIYNVKDNLKVGRLEGMKNDIANLRDKIASYYAQNGKLPASIQYTNISHIKSAGVISDAVDTGDFFVIELSALENLTLNYGEDYEKVKEESGDVNEYDDLYIINEASHNIFYVRGVTIDNETFYTDYTSEKVDSKAVDLRYVEGVKIPDGFYYVSGTKDTGIVIKSNDDTKEYMWVQNNDTIVEIPNDIQIDTNEQEDFIKSANAYKGYYKNTSGNDVIYLEVEKWSPTYDKKGIYKDKNGDTAYIPEGFQVSEVPGQNTIDDGLVVRGIEGSEFVWIPVPDIDDFHTIEGYYEGSLDSTSSVCSEPYAEGYSTEVAEYDAMKASVEENGGFYIGRYETGKVDNQAIVKKDVAVYNYIGWSDSDDMTNKAGGAAEVAKNFATQKGYTSVTSTLCYGVQWDATMQFMDSNYLNGTCNSSSYLVNSTDKGNYSGSLIKTGSNENYAVKNIYDMAGNVYEWTMEACYTLYRVYRGGSFYNDGSDGPASNRIVNSPSTAGSNLGFRVALYLKD